VSARPPFRDGGLEAARKEQQKV